MSNETDYLSKQLNDAVLSSRAKRLNFGSDEMKESTDETKKSTEERNISTKELEDDEPKVMKDGTVVAGEIDSTGDEL